MELEREGGLPPAKKKPGRKAGQRQRTKLEVQRDRAEIERLRLRYRMRLAQIAEEINKFYQDEEEEYVYNDKLVKRPHLTDKQVWVEIQKAAEEYREYRFVTTEEKRLEIIRQFEDLAVFCQVRYDESLKTKVITTKEERNKDGEVTTVEKEVNEKRDGNPRYLDIKAFCLKFIAELEQTIPPKKIAPTNPEGTEGFKFEGGEEFKRLAALAEEAGLFNK